MNYLIETQIDKTKRISHSRFVQWFPIRLSVFVSIHQSIPQSICLPVCAPAPPCVIVCQFITCLSLHWFVCPSVSLLVRPSVCLFVCYCKHLSIYVSLLSQRSCLHTRISLQDTGTQHVHSKQEIERDEDC